MFRGSPWRHCRRRVVLLQLVAILATPRHRQGARQRCCPFGKRRCVGKTYPIRYPIIHHRRPAPIGDRGPRPPANFGDFPSLESHSPGRGDTPRLVPGYRQMVRSTDPPPFGRPNTRRSQTYEKGASHVSKTHPFHKKGDKNHAECNESPGRPVGRNAERPCALAGHVPRRCAVEGRRGRLAGAGVSCGRGAGAADHDRAGVYAHRL